jgi:hypothetical protein
MIWAVVRSSVTYLSFRLRLATDKRSGARAKALKSQAVNLRSPYELNPPCITECVEVIAKTGVLPVPINSPPYRLRVTLQIGCRAHLRFHTMSI